ncbi:MAG: nucleoside-diphosphate kinase [Kiritimatiellae bacterium]|nr:nucleoside-diphosphate kinase [Kiritimatiellia bacterium]
MARELAFVLINPYTIGKSRTGGVIGRIISKTQLDLVAARMFGPSRELVERYAAMLRGDPDVDASVRDLLADYVLRAYMPEQSTGLRRRVLMLLFEGEDAVSKIRQAAGHVRQTMASGRTVRDIYGDYIMDDGGKVLYVEPAVLVGAGVRATGDRLRLWSEFSERDGGIMENTADLAPDAKVQKTLVLIKPDNFRFPSARPGNIIDLFSGSGLRIIGAKVHRMSVAEAEEFYGPVRDALCRKLQAQVGQRASEAVADKLHIVVSEEIEGKLGEMLGPVYGCHQFYEIVQFMTGQWPPDCSPEDKRKPGKEKCLALVYAGVDAVNIIRDILGPTDPSKAAPGSVRREFGRDIMVNAAHASDSPESAERELKIINVAEDGITPWVRKYYPEA